MSVAPVVEAISFDKPGYNAGDLITATVEYEPGMSDLTQSFSGNATDETTGLAGVLTATFVIANGTVDPTDVDASDEGGRTWNKISDSDGIAVFTAIA